MNERQLALTLVLALAAAPVLAQGAHERGGGSSSSGSSGAADRHPGSSGGGSSSGTSFTPSSSGGDASSGTSYARPSSPPSGSSSSTGSRRGSAAERRHPSPRSGGSSSGHGGWTDRRRGSWGGYGGWGYPYYGPYGWGYPYGGYYDGYYWGYYGWGAPYSSYHYAYNYDFGSLRLQVEPDDAEVYVDGYYAGEVDDFNGIFQRLHVRPGRHEIAFKRRGFRTHRVKVYVPVGSTLKIRYDLQPGEASDVTEAEIGSPEEMQRAEKDRARPTWDNESESDNENEEAMENAPPASGSGRPADVRLSIKPADAAVYIDGRFMGNGEDVDELQLAPGKHRVEVVRPGYATFEKEIEVTAGEGRDLKVELEKAGASL